MPMAGTKRVYTRRYVISRPMKRLKTAAQRLSINQKNVKLPSSRGSLAQQVTRVRRYLRDIAPEVKHVDIDLNASNIGDPGNVQLVSNIAQGDTVAQRTGDAVRITHVSCKFCLQMPVASTPVANSTYRVAIFIDKQQVSDNNPALSTVFSPTTPWALRLNLSFLKRFKLLYVSKIFDPRRLAASTALSTGAVPTMSPFMEIELPMNLEVRFNGTSGIDIERNGIYFALVTDDTNDSIDLGCHARVSFVDT